MLKDRFELLETLQRGPMSRTWLGRDHQTQKDVVLKEVSFHDLSPGEGFKPFELMEREGRALRHLDHPGIPKLVEIFEVSEPDTTLWLVMEKKDGQNLEQLVDSGYRGSLPEITRILRATAEILKYLHDRVPPLVHRDVKPKNILLDAEGKVSLVDFGAVATSALTHSTSGSTIVGSPGYVPLEQFAGRARPASDVFALGMVGVFLLTHTEPIKLTDASGRTRWRDQLELESPLLDVIDRMIEPSIDKRISSMTQVIEALDGKVQKKPSRRRAVAIGAAAAVSVAGALVFIAPANGPFDAPLGQLLSNTRGFSPSQDENEPSELEEPVAPPCLPRVTSGRARVFCSEVPQLAAPSISEGRLIFFASKSSLPAELVPETSSAGSAPEEAAPEPSFAIQVTPKGLASLGATACSYGPEHAAIGKDGKVYVVCADDGRMIVSFDPKSHASEEIAGLKQLDEYDVGYGYEGSFLATPPFLVVPDSGRSIVEVIRGPEGLRAQQVRSGAMPFDLTPPKSSEIESDPLFFYYSDGRLHGLYGKLVGSKDAAKVQFVPVVFSTHGKKELSELPTSTTKPRLDACIPTRMYSDGPDLIARIPDELSDSYDELRIPNARPVPGPTSFPVGLETCHTSQSLELFHPAKGRFQIDLDENHPLTDPVTTCNSEGCVIFEVSTPMVLRLLFD